MKYKLIAASLLLCSVAHANSSITHVDNYNGHVGETIHIHVHHSFVVKNDSEQTKNYLVSETCKVDNKHYEKGFGFSLNPHQSKSFGEDQQLDYSATRSGTFKIEAMTAVANSSATSFDHSTLKVN